MPSGANFPDLAQKIRWDDQPARSLATVHSESSGFVALVVERVQSGWRWIAYGWLGVTLSRESNYGTREQAKKSCVTWWGQMTAADRGGFGAP